MTESSPPLDIDNIVLPEYNSVQTSKNLTLCDYFAIIGFDKATGLEVVFF